jgi:hypothetical protein
MRFDLWVSTVRRDKLNLLAMSQFLLHSEISNSRYADYQTSEVSMNLLAKIVFIFNPKTT